MPLTLILLRHAEAEMPRGADRDRELTEHGRAQALAVGRRLRADGILPTLFVHSVAERAVQTADGLAEVFPTAARHAEEALYLAGVRELADSAWSWPTAEVVVAVGHNPGWSEAVAALGGPPVSLGPACGAVFGFEGTNWGEALLDRGRYLRGLSPS